MLPKRFTYTKTVDIFKRINTLVKDLRLGARYAVEQHRPEMSAAPPQCRVYLMSGDTRTLLVEGRSRDAGAFALGVLQALEIVEDVETRPTPVTVNTTQPEPVHRWRPSVSLDG